MSFLMPYAALKVFKEKKKIYIYIHLYATTLKVCQAEYVNPQKF